MSSRNMVTKMAAPDIALALIVTTSSIGKPPQKKGLFPRRNNHVTVCFQKKNRSPESSNISNILSKRRESVRVRVRFFASAQVVGGKREGKFRNIFFDRVVYFLGCFESGRRIPRAQGREG